mgnify:CR=1 FL=1
MDFSLLLSSYATVWSNPEVLLMTFIGALGGVLLGAIPGMTATMGVALLIPFSFGMDLIPSIGLLLGIYCGGMYGGSISAILIHAPGTPAAAATLLDGYPMCQKGQAGKALSVAMFASFVGGVIGALIMTFLSPIIADMAMNFGPGEMFMLAVFGLSVIVAISGKSIAKGLVSAFFGMLLCTVGLDPTNGIPRFITYKQTGLLEGFQFIPTLIGLFAVTEVFKQTDPKKKRLSAEDGISGGRVSTKMPSFKEIWSIKWTMLRCSVIGTIVGILPGAGATIASFMCYTMETKLSKHPEKFGTGIIDGIAASEASNNAATGGAMVPLLSLGIPGGNAAAVMMSALTLKGVQLGPLLLTNQPTYLSATFMSMIVTNVLMVVVAMAIAKVFAQILAIPYSYLGPIIMMLALIGTYGDQMSATSVQIMVLAGILGLVVRACHLNSAAIVLGLVLGNMCEQNFSRGYLMARANVFQMFNPTLHPIAFVLIIVCIVLLVSPVFMSMRKKKAAS